MSDLVPVKPYLFEIPKTGGMRVPGRVYATQELLGSQKIDDALQQVRHVAHLPGIVDYSLAMPDFHWGYGFPIGGVAAFDAEEGVISPGGVGYDINCLAGDTPVLFPDGYTRPLQDLVESRSPALVSHFVAGPKILSSARVVAGLASAPRRRVWEIRTSSGRRVVATEDHPFLTPDGMREIKDLGPGSPVAVVPFEGVPYERPSKDVIVSERDLRRIAERIGKSDRRHGLSQCLRALARVLPLTADHPAFPVLLKVAGYVLGDGAICFSRRGFRGSVLVNGRRADLERMIADLRPWFRMSRVYRRDRTCRVNTTYGMRRFEAREHFARLRSTGFALLLAALGIPVGRKSVQDWTLPAYLPRLPLWQQRLFLAGFFGAELTCPRPLGKDGRGFQCPILTVVKREGFVESGERFLSGIARRLEAFGVQPLTVLRRQEQTNPDGRRSIRLSLVLSGRDADLIPLWTRVGFEYNRKRSLAAACAAAYLREKQAYLKVRRATQARILELRARTGWGAGKIRAALGGEGTPVPLRFVERTIYGSGDRTCRVGSDFPSFREWRRSATRGLGRSGAVWDPIVAKIPRDDVRRVYDITVDRSDHNFIAAGFIVHN